MLGYLATVGALLLALWPLESNAREDAVAELAEYLEATRSNLSYIERREFDRLRELTAIHRKKPNLRELYKAHTKLLSFLSDSEQAWRYAAWSVGYLYRTQEIEVSEEEDYRSAKLGIQILANGILEHPESAFLCDELGWYLGFRLDPSHGSGSLRRLFQVDAELHQMLSRQIDLEKTIGVEGEPDNWLVAKAYYEKAVFFHEAKGSSLGSRSPVLLFDRLPVCLSRYAINLAKEGHFGEERNEAWNAAAHSWDQLANREFDIEGKDFSIRLNDYDELKRQIESEEQTDDDILLRFRYVKTRRDLHNFDQWKGRCELEKNELVTSARRATYKARVRLTQEEQSGNTLSDRANELFIKSFREWAAAYDQHDPLYENDLIAANVIEEVELYRDKFLDGKELPADFPLNQVLDWIQ